MKSRLLGVVCGCALIATSANSALVSINANDYDHGTIVNNIFPGITLTAVGDEPKLTGQVVIITKPLTDAAGADFVFGYVQSNNVELAEYQPPHTLFQIDFNVETDFISIEFANGNINEYIGALRAYDSNDVLLAEALTPRTGRFDTVWASINRTQQDIAYIQATSSGGGIVSVDAFEYNAVPIPPSVWLFGSGLIGLVGVARLS